MQWKMAPNSLFAILLRSPWWISFAVVLMFVLASLALLPAPYVVFGWMAALPFLVIGSITAWRQLRAPSQARVEQTLQQLAAMPWRDFCPLLEQAYAAQGYQVERLANTGAADLVLRQGARTTLVAARRWKAGSHGVEPLRALGQERQRQDASGCIYITLTDVGAATQRIAQQQSVELVNDVALVQLLARHMPVA